jgi:hypothetical protein
VANQKVDRRLVRDNLRQASLTTASFYLYVDGKRRQQETAKNFVLTGSEGRVVAPETYPVHSARLTPVTA